MFEKTETSRQLCGFARPANRFGKWISVVPLGSKTDMSDGDIKVDRNAAKCGRTLKSSLDTITRSLGSGKDRTGVLDMRCQALTRWCFPLD